jgi:hypothetical protein
MWEGTYGAQGLHEINLGIVLISTSCVCGVPLPVGPSAILGHWILRVGSKAAQKTPSSFVGFMPFFQHHDSTLCSIHA